MNNFFNNLNEDNFLKIATRPFLIVFFVFFIFFFGKYINRSKVEIFKTPDYDLNKDERKAKYKDYDHVLCGKCNQEINQEINNYYCNNCYHKEIDKNERNCMNYGRCNLCFKANTNSNGCLPCITKYVRKGFNEWTSENNIIDQLIQDNQLSSIFSALEWIPHNKFTDIKYIAKGGFANVYSAIWTDGRIKKWDRMSNNWERSGPEKIALKVLNDSKNISEEFLNEVKFFNQANGFPRVLRCLGISKDPITYNFVLVLEYMENDLRSYLNQNFNSITWKQNLIIIGHICYGLCIIHDLELVHKDLHPGNTLINNNGVTRISDFGFCMPANETLSELTRKNIYGVMSYMAPEILRGKRHTKESDIYSLGIIINEIMTATPPFSDQPHDHFLALDICRGLRPKIKPGTPKFLEELIKKCWDANPEKRPMSKEIYRILLDHIYKDENLEELSYESTSLRLHPQAIYSSRLLNLPPYLPNPINHPNQQEFVPSRNNEEINSSHSECYDCAIID